jgi:hypothetical protein
MNDIKYADWLKQAATSEISSVRLRTATALSDSLAKAPEPGKRRAAFEHYWQTEAAKADNAEATGQASTRMPSANAFLPAGAPPSHIVAALPEIDNDVAVAAFRDHATSLSKEAERDDDRFDAEGRQQ